MTARGPVRSLIGLAVLGVGLATSVVSCGGADPFCGDGETDEDEQCDDGNMDQSDFCRDCQAYLPPRTVVKWLFNADAAEGFAQDNCVDLRVSRVQVELTGPMSATLDDACPTRQVVFQDLPPGTYTASVTPLDVDGNSLVDVPVTASVIAMATDTETTMVVPFESWSGSYTGSFNFRLRWGGADCSLAMPPVAQQLVTLTVGGTVVSQMTTAGRSLDGTPGDCVPFSEASPQTALLVPFGPATIVIVGHDSGGTESFQGTFDTFVGAGLSNPELEYDVPTVYDAGI